MGYLHWEHIQPIRGRNNDNDGKNIVAAKIVVYSGEEGDEYFSFITPEAYYELEKWMDYRKSSGEKITGKSWVLRNVWNTRRGFNRGLVAEPEKLKSSGVKRVMEDALWTQRLRSKLEPGKRRHEFQTDHGFRKWFKTRCEIAGMKPINIEKLMGHSVGISDSYYRATENELLEDYLKAVPVLTIGREYRIQKNMEELKEQSKNSVTDARVQLFEKERAIAVLTERDSLNADAIASLSDKMQEMPHPYSTYEDPPASGTSRSASIPRTYIHCTLGPLSPWMEPFASRASKLGWNVHTMTSGHDVMITRPKELAKILIQIANK